MTITHNNTAFSMVAPLSGGGAGECTYNGTYTQTGRMGAVAGTFACTGGFSGTFNAFEIEANITGLTARVVAQSNACSYSGRVGGLRRSQ